MTFKQDFRVSKPKLHELYVRWAMTHLDAANQFIEEMDGFSNYNAGQLCQPVREAMAKLIDENAAYHDAAARLFAGHEPPPYDEDLSVAEEATTTDTDLSGEKGSGEPLNTFFQDYTKIEERILSCVAGATDPLRGKPIVNAKGLEPGAYTLERVPAGWYARKAAAEGDHEVGAGNPFSYLVGKTFKVRMKDGKAEGLEFEEVAIPAEPAQSTTSRTLSPMEVDHILFDVFGPGFFSRSIPIIIPIG